MAEHTKIEWADATVNFWAGCTKVSPACDHCYAEKMAVRLWGLKWGPSERRQHFQGAADTLVKLDRKAQKLGVILSPFINSLSDFFDNEVGNFDRMNAIEVMSDCRHLRPLLLTKRIGNVAPYLQRDSLAFDLISSGRIGLGITVCNQAEADRDIPKLMAVPAVLRFLSLEPLLGPVNLRSCIDDEKFRCGECDHSFNCTDETERPRLECPMCGHDPVMVDQGRIDWVIVGGESGPGARPMHPDWARSLRDQCQAADVPFFFKQWGEHAPNWLNDDAGNKIPGSEWIDRMGKKIAGRLLDGVEHNGRPA